MVLLGYAEDNLVNLSSGYRIVDTVVDDKMAMIINWCKCFTPPPNREPMLVARITRIWGICDITFLVSKV